jgi:hypothetical protein
LMLMDGAVGAGGRFATVTLIVTTPDSGGVPLSVTVIARLSLPVKLGAVYVSREEYFSPSVVANNSLTILPDSRCGR